MARCLSGWSFSIHDTDFNQAAEDRHAHKHGISNTTPNWSMLPHMQQFVLLTSVFFEVISEVIEHSNTVSSSDRQTTSRTRLYRVNMHTHNCDTVYLIKYAFVCVTRQHIVTSHK